MTKCKCINWCLGLPKGVSSSLRKALAAELERMGSTYQECVDAAGGPITPEIVLELARGWNNLTPNQQAAWHSAAKRRNMGGADLPQRN
jgi:hypothetical protein